MQFDPPVIAHRGASAYAPENTMVSFVRAAQLGINWIEFDVMLAACGTPIIFHDETLDRTTNSHGDVGRYTYHYLRSLDAGQWLNPIFSGERIPSLDQVLQFVMRTNIFCNLEIKPLPNQDEQTVVNILQVLKNYLPDIRDNILFSSFSIVALNKLQQLFPDSMRGFLIHEWVPGWEQHAENLDCISIHVNEKILTKEIAQKIKDSGKLLLCYTVNDADRAEELYSWGVDAVFSDHPDQIARFVY